MYEQPEMESKVSTEQFRESIVTHTRSKDEKPFDPYDPFRLPSSIKAEQCFELQFSDRDIPNISGTICFLPNQTPSQPAINSTENHLQIDADRRQDLVIKLDQNMPDKTNLNLLAKFHYAISLYLHKLNPNSKSQRFRSAYIDIDADLLAIKAIDRKSEDTKATDKESETTLFYVVITNDTIRVIPKDLPVGENLALYAAQVIYTLSLHLKKGSEG